MDTLDAPRAEYRAITPSLADLEAAIRAGTGPAINAATATLLDLRRRVDADRPHALTIAAIVEQWSDADAAYDDAVLLVEHASAQLVVAVVSSSGDSGLGGRVSEVEAAGGVEGVLG